MVTVTDRHPYQSRRLKVELRRQPGAFAGLRGEGYTPESGARSLLCLYAWKNIAMKDIQPKGARVVRRDKEEEEDEG
jgi:hypothetical protein